MLTKISIKNFKGIGHVDIDLSKLNVFIGENGAGKSTVIHALSILKRSLNSSGINTDLPYINLGPLHNLVPAGESTSIMIEGEEKVELKSIHVTTIKFSSNIEFDVQGLREYSITVNTDNEKIASITNYYGRHGQVRVQPNQIQIAPFTFSLSATAGIGQPFQLGGYSNPSGGDQNVLKEGQKMYAEFAELGSTIIKTLQRFYVVPPLRGFLEPVYALQPNITEEFNPRASFVQMGAALASNLIYLSEDVKKKVINWMKKVMNVDVSWKPEQGLQAIISNPKKNTYFVNEGFGSNQLTMILEELARTPEGSLIVIEEPEIHFHPVAQFKFGQLMTTIIKEELNKQILLVTHSEHIVSAILTAIRHKELKPNDVSIYVFEKKDDGKNTATKAEIDEEGNTKDALLTFIQAQLSELKEYVKEKV